MQLKDVALASELKHILKVISKFCPEMPSEEDSPMEHLHDELLLSVFGYLAKSDLLLIRGVCSRWKDLALHPRLWRRVFINDVYVGQKFLGAVLNVVPCLGKMSLTLDYPHIALVKTNCSVKSLCLSVWDNRAVMAKRALERQLENGCLRELRIILHGNYAEFVGLMETVCRARDLLKLTLRNYKPPIGGTVPKMCVPSSLLEFHSDAPATDRHHQNIMYAHRKTLEVLCLPACTQMSIRVLSMLQVLRSVECPPHKDLRMLLTTASLTSVSIRMESSANIQESDVERVRDAVDGTVAFLEEASGVKEYKLFAVSTVPGLGLVDKLIKAPAKLGRLHAFELETMSERLAESCQATLARCLPRFRQLRCIALSCPAASALLDAMTPANVPLLQKLHVVTNFCAHEYMHEPKVENLLYRYEQLHVFIRDNSRCSRYNQCYTCREGCHAAVFRVTPRRPNIGVFGHPENASSCDEEMHSNRQNVITWVRLQNLLEL